MAGGKIQKSGIKPTNVILEIGLSTGNLTKKLLEVAKSVVTIKLDPRIQAPMMTRLRCSFSRLTTALGVSSQGMTPLMHAVRHGHADAVHLLLTVGAPWNAQSPSSLSAGDLAMEDSHQDAFDILLNATIQAELILGTITRADHKKEEATTPLDPLGFSMHGRFGHEVAARHPTATKLPFSLSREVLTLPPSPPHGSPLLPLRPHHRRLPGRHRPSLSPDP